MEPVWTGERRRLFTVARSLFSSKRRRCSARSAEPPIDEQKALPAGNEIDRVLLNWQVIEVLRELSDDHRDVIIELFYRRRTVSEAAQVLGVSPGTVKSRSHCALHALRALLEQRGVLS